ncbi:Alpha-galactosidase [Lacticaseibacillus rhamnosus LOCK908]|nr:Alpha-galactosidase [Lacticaseibacillus rhamnosus LOCK908]CAR90161.1 Putative protein without homology [Lacticaseibacillus rhamnosus Lc 705]
MGWGCFGFYNAAVGWSGLFSETRSQGQKPAHKDLGRNGQSPAITSKAAYAPVSKRPCSRSVSETRSQGQKPAHKDLGRNGQSPAITSKATYAPVSKRPCSRS